MNAACEYPQSGLVPVRHRDGRVEVLLITNKGGDCWIFPKGLIEDYLTSTESAQKESFEEAGVVGTVGERIGAYQYEKWGGICNVEMFLLEDVRELPSWPEDYRERRWVLLDKGLKSVVPEELEAIVDNLLEIFKKEL